MISSITLASCTTHVQSIITLTEDGAMFGLFDTKKVLRVIFKFDFFFCSKLKKTIFY